MACICCSRAVQENIIPSLGYGTDAAESLALKTQSNTYGALAEKIIGIADGLSCGAGVQRPVLARNWDATPSVALFIMYTLVSQT